MDYSNMNLEQLFAAADKIMDKDIYKEPTPEQVPTVEQLVNQADEIMSKDIYQEPTILPWQVILATDTKELTAQFGRSCYLNGKLVAWTTMKRYTVKDLIEITGNYGVML